MGGGRRDGARLHDRLRRGRARLARRRPALGARRVRARLDPRALADARARADPARRRARRAARPLLAARARHHRRAVEPGALPLALRARRRRPLPDHQLLRRHRGRRLLPLAHARGADQVVLARRAGAGDGDGRRRLGGPLGARRGRRARLPQAVPRDDARLLARPASATSTRTGGGCPGSGCTATGPPSTRTATGSCTAAPTTRSTSPASGSGLPSWSRPWSRIRRWPRRRPSACRTR